MKADYGKIYESPSDFFELKGSVTMQLSPAAAIEVCRMAAAHRLVVARIEGGIWLNPGFESRLDCIWDGADPPLDTAAAHANNLLAIQFIENKRDVHDVFILTAPSVTGWAHRATSSPVSPGQ